MQNALLNVPMHLEIAELSKELTEIMKNIASQEEVMLYNKFLNSVNFEDLTPLQ